LPDASITDAGLKMTLIDAAVPEAAQQVIDQTAMMLPHLKITELLWKSTRVTSPTSDLAR
jgi:hypothetical protein